MIALRAFGKHILQKILEKIQDGGQLQKYGPPFLNGHHLQKKNLENYCIKRSSPMFNIKKDFLFKNQR
jgi:hypothetical protein